MSDEYTHAPTPSDFTLPPDPPNPEIPSALAPSLMNPSLLPPSNIVMPNDMPFDPNAPVDFPMESPFEIPVETPVEAPVEDPTQFPTFAEPTFEPTLTEILEPTLEPTEKPSHKPTREPTAEIIETIEPTHKPTRKPTDSENETDEPTYKPTKEPTYKPTHSPTLGEGETYEPSMSLNDVVSDEPTVSSIDFSESNAPTSSSFTFSPTPSTFTYSPTPEPSASVIATASPTALPTSSPAFYQSSGFISAIVVILLFIGVGIANYFYIKQLKEKQTFDDNEKKHYDRVSPSDSIANRGDLENAEAVPTEVTPMLASAGGDSKLPVVTATPTGPTGAKPIAGAARERGGGGPSTPSGSMGPPPSGAAASPAAPASAAAVASPAVAVATVPLQFSPADLGGGPQQDQALLEKFNKILSGGIVINLHTTKGPRPVKFSIQGDEVRWEAATKKETAGKRYKLKLADVNYVEIGKATSNFQKDLRAEEELCFSLVTQKTTLDLETRSKLERDSLARGFQISVDRVKGAV